MNKLKVKSPLDHYLGDEVFKDEFLCESDKKKYLKYVKRYRKTRTTSNNAFAYEE